MKFKNRDAVKWDCQRWQTADCENGYVVGYATTDMPVIGAMVIVSVMHPLYRSIVSKTYPFECFTIPEVALELDVEEMKTRKLLHGQNGCDDKLPPDDKLPHRNKRARIGFDGNEKVNCSV